MEPSFGFLWTMIAVARPEDAAKAGRVASRLYRWADIAAQLPPSPAASPVRASREPGPGDGSSWHCDPDATTEAIPIAAFRRSAGL